MFTIRRLETRQMYGKFRTIEEAEACLTAAGYKKIDGCYVIEKFRGGYYCHSEIVSLEPLPISEMPTSSTYKLTEEERKQLVFL